MLAKPFGPADLAAMIEKVLLEARVHADGGSLLNS
jgi:hypothetical protein